MPLAPPPGPLPRRFPRWTWPALLAALGVGGAVGVGTIAAGPGPTTVEPESAAVTIPATAPVVVAPAPAEEAVGQIATTDCDAENARLCPEFYRAGVGLAPVSNWAEVAAAKGYLCTVQGQEVPCASAKLAGIACQLDHAAEKSKACLAKLEGMYALNAAIGEQCRADQQKWCSSVSPEERDNCLNGHRAEVSAACLAALDAQAAAIAETTGR